MAIKSRTLSFINSNIYFYVVLFVTMLVTNFPFGFRYFPFADDYNQYGVYSLYRTDIWQNVMVRFSNYGMRPLAGLTDAYVIAWFWGQLHWVLLAIVVLRFCTIVLLDNVLKRSNIVWGRAAAVFFAFFPGIAESAYWISASSRIVVSAFFALFAAHAMLNFLYHARWRKCWFALAIISGFLAQGYYEQGIIFSFVIIFGLLIIHRKAISNKLLHIWPFVNLLVIGTHYFFMRNVGHLYTRSALTVGNPFGQAFIIFTRVMQTFYCDHTMTAIHTIRWGAMELAANYTILAIIISLLGIMLACSIAFDKMPECHENKNNFRLSFIAGIVLFTSTFGIFVVLKNAWIFARNTFFSIIGLGIFVEIAVKSLRFDRYVGTMVLKAVIAFLFTTLFTFSYILEVQSIQRTERNDAFIVSNLVDVAKSLDITIDDTVWVLGLLQSYEQKINARITSQIIDSWAIKGHFEAVTRNSRSPNFIPIMSGAAVNFSDYDFLLGLDENLNVRVLELQNGELFFVDTGETFGIVKEGYFYSTRVERNE